MLFQIMVVEAKNKKASHEIKKNHQTGDKMMSLDGLEPAEKRYRAWVNNKVTVLIWVIERNKPRDSRSMLKHEFFLEEIEHHFMDCHASYRAWRAFRYLRGYLKSYPHAKVNHQRTALAMLRLIYEELGFSGQRISVPDFKEAKSDMGKNVEYEEVILTPAA